MRYEGTTHKHNVARFFSHSVRYWEDIYEENPGRGEEFSSYAKNRRKGIVLDYLDTYAHQRSLAVLDIGCGPGVLLEEALHRGHTVSGIDISEEMVNKANERLGKNNPGYVTCQQGDIENLPFGNETMDVVFCLGVLPYLTDDSTARKEIDRVLKNGGIVIVILANLFKLGNLLDPYYYCVRIWQYIRYQLINKNKTANVPLKPDTFGTNREFNIRRYTCKQALGLFSSYGKVIKERMTGIEYGPLTLWKRTLLPDRLSIKLSECISKHARKWPFLTYLSNEWVICYIKQASRENI